MYFFGYTVKYDESSGEVIEIKGEKNKKKDKNELEEKIIKKKNGKEDKEISDKKEEDKKEIQNEDKKEEIRIEKNSIKETSEIKDEKKDPAIVENNKLKSAISNKKTLKGDIDFLISDLKPEELKKVLNNKELAPFIFYGNINQESNSDLIGEIKENFSTGDKKHINQLNKYRQILKLSKKDDAICKKFGLTKNNQKIIIIIFNNSYKEYLKRMLLYKSLSKAFIELNDSPMANNLYQIYSKNYQEEENNLRNYDFIREIINSQNPYIFIFIQDILTLCSILNQKSKEDKSRETSNINEKKENNEIDSNSIKDKEKTENKPIIKEKSEMAVLVDEIREIKKLLIIQLTIIIIIFIILIFKRNK